MTSKDGWGGVSQGQMLPVSCPVACTYMHKHHVPTYVHTTLHQRNLNVAGKDYEKYPDIPTQILLNINLVC
jgi:hypothetical protein